MIDPEDRRAQLSPQLAMRVAILGGIAFAIFGIIFFRLWFLQVLSGDQYLAQASTNRVRTVTVQAPRGEMTDRDGNVLVENRAAVSIVVSPQRLPHDEAKRHALFRRLSFVLGRSTRPQKCRFGSGDTASVRMEMALECRVDQSVGALPYADVVVEPDAPKAAYTYLAERSSQFPGVQTQNAWLREYPYGGVGAQLFGTVGQIDADELREPKYRGVRGGSIVGKTGLEAVYDHYLRGVDGQQRIQVNAQGQPTTGRPLRDVPPVKGSDLRLSIDLRLERVGQQALKTGERLAQGLNNPANGGAFVALDPRNGQVLAMGSDPTFDPNVFAKPVTERVYKSLTSPESNFPLFNRATNGTFAVGSTFKPVTSTAALASGKWSVGQTYDDTGTWRSGLQVRRNAGGAAFGVVDLTKALAYSVDTFYYNLGSLLNVPPEGHPRGGALQEWARQYGFGSPTGIDLDSEAKGTVPDPNEIRALQDAQRRCLRERRGPCNIANLDDTWTVGDNASFAVGQGDFLATPLQMAVAYAAIENGGTIVTPHIGMQALNSREQVVQTFSPRPARRIDIPQDALDAIREGLLESTTIQGGTTTDVFQGFGKQVYGKTGTAQITGKPDQSLYVAYVPDQVRPIVVACVIQNGGFGAQAAAPAVRQILSQWFYGHPGRAVAGSSATL